MACGLAQDSGGPGPSGLGHGPRSLFMIYFSLEKVYNIFLNTIIIHLNFREFLLSLMCVATALSMVHQWAPNGPRCCGPNPSHDTYDVEKCSSHDHVHLPLFIAHVPRLSTALAALHTILLHVHLKSPDRALLYSYEVALPCSQVTQGCRALVLSTLAAISRVRLS